MGIMDGIFICLIGPVAFDLLGPAGAAQVGKTLHRDVTVLSRHGAKD